MTAARDGPPFDEERPWRWGLRCRGSKPLYVNAVWTVAPPAWQLQHAPHPLYSLAPDRGGGAIAVTGGHRRDTLMADMLSTSGSAESAWRKRAHEGTLAAAQNNREMKPMQTHEATARDQALDFALEVMTNVDNSLDHRLSAAQLILRHTQPIGSEAAAAPQAETPPLMQALEQFLQGPGQAFMDEFLAMKRQMTEPYDTRRV